MAGDRRLPRPTTSMRNSKPLDGKGHASKGAPLPSWQGCGGGHCVDVWERELDQLTEDQRSTDYY